jgi:hypothetical protein
MIRLITHLALTNLTQCSKSISSLPVRGIIETAADATAALTIGATTTLAVSNTQTHQFQLMGDDDRWPSSSKSASNVIFRNLPTITLQFDAKWG